MTIEEAIKIFSNYALVGTLEETGVDVAFDSTPDQMRAAIEVVRSALRAQRETEKNEPLTLEELKQMDGHPVYVKRQGYGELWALVYAFWKSRGIIHLTYSNGASDSAEFLLNDGAEIYRHPPGERFTPAVL